MKKLLALCTTVLLCVAMNPALAKKPGERRTGSPSVVEEHLTHHGELKPYIGLLGITQASPKSGASCTIDGVLMEKQPHHCRDYTGYGNDRYRIVYNGVTGQNGAARGSDETQKIYQIVKVQIGENSYRYQLVLKVRFENGVVMYDALGGGHAPDGTSSPKGTTTVDPAGRETLDGIGGVLHQAFPDVPLGGLGGLFGR